MRFNLLVKYVDSDDIWKETYDKECVSAEDMGRSIIDYWNDTLRPHETAREFVGVEVLESQIVVQDPMQKQITIDHENLDYWAKNGEVYANQSLYTSHIEGLIDLDYTEKQLEDKLDRISRLAYDTFCETLDVDEFENSMGCYYDAFSEGFMIQYMKNCEKIKEKNKGI